MLLFVSAGCGDDKDPGATLATMPPVLVSDGGGQGSATHTTQGSATHNTSKTSEEPGATSVDTEPTDGGSADASASSGDTGGGSSTGAAAGVDYEADIQPIWDQSCSCHLAGGGSGGLVLAAGQSYANLVLVSSPSSGLFYVFPGSLDDSYLWHKLDGTQLDVGGNGAMMPLVGQLEPDDLDRIATWIAEGALP